MGNRKAPGVDGIPNEVWKGLVKIFPKYITAIYNKCLKEGVFPRRWKIAKIIPIVKPGKEGSDEVSKFRPISLLASGGKVLEKLLINRINHHVYTRGHMNENQFGFRPQKSTVDAALAIKDFVQKSIEAGDVVALASLDVQGAFGAAWWPGILRELRKCNCPKNLYKLTRNYFSQRTAVLSSNSIKVEKSISRGCPQGSTCGPGFWNLQFNSLLGMQFMARTKVVAYADDLLIATRGDSVRAVENYANIELSKIEGWSRRNKIKFNDKKSKVMLVTRRKRKEDKDITLYLHSKPLEQVRQMKYLGLILDQKFKFQEHIKYTTERCAKLTHNLSRVARLTWGLRYGAIATIYKGAILPLLSYGAPVWIEAMKHQHNRQKLKRVQRLINLRMARAFRTTSGDALCILTAMKPIIIKIEEIVKQHEFKGRQPQREDHLDHEVEYRHWPHSATAVTIK